MHSIRKRLGLMLFASIWLAVLLVPSWRWRAGNQLREQRYGFGLSPDLERVAVRGFPNDAAAQFAPLRGIRQNDWTEIYGGAAHNAANNRAIEARYFGRYDELQRRFPDANFGRIQRLRDTCIGGFALDEGPNDSSFPTAPHSMPAPSPTPRPTPWFPADQREAALSVAREGARRDPENGFFPWMEAILEFSFRRNERALRAFDAAGHCPNWSDDTLGTPRRRLEVLGRLRFVASEDQVSELYSMLLPHLAPMHAVARAALWQAKQARQRGEKQRAWEIISSLQRAAGIMATRADGSILSRRTGQYICVNVWNFALTGQIAPPPTPDEADLFHPGAKSVAAQEEFRRALVERFAAYAGAQGHDDLARQARVLVSQMDCERLQAVYGLQPAQSVPWVRPVAELGRAYYLNTMALRCVLLAAPLWVLCALLTQGREELTTPILRRSLLLSMCGAGICGWVMVLLWRLEVGDSIFLPAWGATDIYPIPPLLWSLAPFALPFEMWALGSLVWLAFKRTPWKSPGQVAKKAVSLTPRLARGPVRPQRILSLSIASLLGLAVWAAWREGPDVAAFLWSDNGNLILIPALCGALGVSVWLLVTAKKRRAALACWVAAFWVVVLSAMFDALGIATFLIALALVVAGLVLAGWRVRLDKTLRARAFRFLILLAAWVRPACAVISLMASLVYFALSLQTIATEQTAKAQLARELQIGEAAFLREQLGK